MFAPCVLAIRYDSGPSTAMSTHLPSSASTTDEYEVGM